MFMKESQPRFVPLAAKSVVCHTITYFLMGALAYKFLHYAATINNPNSGMRPTTSTWVLPGPALQIFRGILFASVFYLFREQLFGRKDGWLRMAWMLIGIGILGTFAAPPLSQMKGYLEVVTQAALLSVLLCYWVNTSGKKWMSWTLGVGYVICAG